MADYFLAKRTCFYSDLGVKSTGSESDSQVQMVTANPVVIVIQM